MPNSPRYSCVWLLSISRYILIMICQRQQSMGKIVDWPRHDSVTLYHRIGTERLLNANNYGHFRLVFDRLGARSSYVSVRMCTFAYVRMCTCAVIAHRMELAFFTHVFCVFSHVPQLKSRKNYISTLILILENVF